MENTEISGVAGDAARGLVGREREQTALGSVLSRMLAGHGSVVLVSGEAGIGKTTLVESVCRDAVAQDAIVLAGHCYDLIVTPPYGPWLEITLEYRPRQGWPALPAFINDRHALDDLSGQDALFEQVWGFYADLSDKQPLVLVLEDLQWADAPSLELLRFFGRHASNRRMLLIATYRDDELTPTHPLYQFIPHIVRETKAMRIKLNQFDWIDTGELIQSRYDLIGKDLQRLLAYLQGRSEGNPFFIEELLRSLIDEKLLHIDEDGWRVADLTRAPLPSLVRQVVDVRLRKLDDETRRLLSFGAVIGESIPSDLWRQLTELDDDEFVRQLRPAIEQHIVVEGQSNNRLRFSHALIQATLYESVIPPQRALWHRSVGEALAIGPTPDPSLVADHFRRANDPRAVEWLIRAGRRAQRLYAWRIAVDRFEDAMSLLERDESRLVERGWLCYRLGRVLCFRDAARSRQYVDQSFEIAERTGDELLRACAVTELGYRHVMNGDYRQALELMERGFAAYDRLLEQRFDPSDGQPTAESLKRGMDELRGKRIVCLAAVESYDKAMDQARGLLGGRLRPNDMDDGIVGETASSAGLANAYTALGLCYGALGQIGRAREAFSWARDLHRNPFALALTIDAELMMVTLPYRMDEPDVLESQAQAANRRIEDAIESGIAVEGVYSMTGVALNIFRGNDWRQTLQMLAQAKSVHFDAFWKHQSMVFAAAIARNLGEVQRAWDEVHAMLPNGPATEVGTEQIFCTPEMVALAANLLMDSHDVDRARAWLECHDRWIDRPGSIRGRAEGYLLWAKYYRHDGDTERARRHAEQSLAIACEPRQPFALLAAHRFLGLLDIEAGEFSSAEKHLTEALELCSACLARYERAQTLLVLARLQRASGRVDDARAILSEVRSICEPLEAKPALAEADEIGQLLNRAAGVPSQQTDLTTRELEVLRLVSRGMTDAEIADALYIGRRTVGTHLSSIYGKLGVRSRTEATRFALEHDLV